MKKFESWWVKFLAYSASVVATVAILSAEVMCVGKYYQPVMPERLRK